MMRNRLRLLLTTFNKAVMDYALARLEVALENPSAPAPPLVNRLGLHRNLEDGSGPKWPAALSQAGAAAGYVAAGNRGELAVKHDLAWIRLARCVNLLARYAESIDWIGVEQRVDAAGEGGR